MTAADQIVRTAKKVLAMEGRPHMTTQSLANRSQGGNSLLAGKMQGIFTKIGPLRKNFPDRTQQNQFVRG
jgi:hypothetical protein